MASDFNRLLDELEELRKENRDLRNRIGEFQEDKRKLLKENAELVKKVNETQQALRNAKMELLSLKNNY